MDTHSPGASAPLRATVPAVFQRCITKVYAGNACYRGGFPACLVGDTLCSSNSSDLEARSLSEAVPRHGVINFRQPKPRVFHERNVHKTPFFTTSMPGNGGTRIAFSAARSFLAPIQKAEKAESHG